LHVARDRPARSVFLTKVKHVHQNMFTCLTVGFGLRRRGLTARCRLP
jgi:hypothetical protein